jgi:hypothetical protein
MPGYIFLTNRPEGGFGEVEGPDWGGLDRLVDWVGNHSNGRRILAP